MLGQQVRAVPIGRDVVIDVAAFDMVGRKYRNLRQAVQRTHNCGITTEVVAEQDLPDDALLAELTEVILTSPSGLAPSAASRWCSTARSRADIRASS